jgi:6-phosphogluconolactonase
VKTILPVLLIPFALAAQAQTPASKPAQAKKPAKAPTPTPVPPLRLYVGTYTNGEAKGIYQLRLQPGPGTASVQEERPPTSAVSPSFLVMNQDGTRLFAVNETGESADDAAGGVSSYAVDKATGELRLVSRSSSFGPAPCHISLDREEKHVLVANYWGGSIAVFPVLADGRLGAATAFVRHTGTNPTPRDPGPHAHAIEVDPTNRFVFVADLGLDKVFVYDYDGEKGTLGPEPLEVTLPKGSGPRHIAFAAEGATVYVLNELNATVSVLAWEPEKKALRRFQTISTLSEVYKGPNSSAELAVSPDGRFLYASNRGPDDIAIFAIEPGPGTLTPVGLQSTGGKHPRHFAIDPSGEFLVAANRDTDSLNLFRIDRATGLLTPAGEFKTPRPVCVSIRRLAR